MIYPPEIKSGGEVGTWTKNELHELGYRSRNEIVMGLLALTALVLWISAGTWIAATSVALLVVATMILTGILSWNDLLSYKQAWSVLVWFATLVALADGPNRVGFLSWFGKLTAHSLAGVPVPTIVLLLAFSLGLMGAITPMPADRRRSLRERLHRESRLLEARQHPRSALPRRDPCCGHPLRQRDSAPDDDN